MDLTLPIVALAVGCHLQDLVAWQAGGYIVPFKKGDRVNSRVVYSQRNLAQARVLWRAKLAGLKLPAVAKWLDVIPEHIEAGDVMVIRMDDDGEVGATVINWSDVDVSDGELLLCIALTARRLERPHSQPSPWADDLSWTSPASRTPN